MNVLLPLGNFSIRTNLDHSEYRDSMFLRNVGIFNHYTVQKLKNMTIRMPSVALQSYGNVDLHVCVLAYVFKKCRVRTVFRVSRLSRVSRLKVGVRWNRLCIISYKIRMW